MNKKEILEEYEEFLDDYKKEQRELVRQEVWKKLDYIFEEEDKIINKAMKKVNYLMTTRNINQEKERKELVDFRNKMKKELSA